MFTPDQPGDEPNHGAALLRQVRFEVSDVGLVDGPAETPDGAGSEPVRIARRIAHETHEVEQRGLQPVRGAERGRRVGREQREVPGLGQDGGGMGLKKARVVGRMP